MEPFDEVYPEGTKVFVVAGPLRGIRGVIAKIHNNNKLIWHVTYGTGLGLSIDVDASTGEFMRKEK